ncbi:extracellular solute-binding protein [Rhodovulum sp. DZ06]|uniref:extracellular solute-binding protein n=1 Tax=Rhodovulum sp. DZ06 TaxID=3425126 RepID=UPI003D32C9E0
MSFDTSRRSLLAGLAAAGGLGALPGSLRGALAQSVGDKLAGDGEVIVCTWGGNYSDMMQKIWFDPFSDATGIGASTTAIPDMAKLEVMDRVNNVEWDLIDTKGAQMIQAARKGLPAPIDYDLVFSIVPKEAIDPAAIRAYGIGSVAFSTVIAWNTDTVGKDGPQTWKEVFDTSRFKGRRALYAQPRPTFEIALLAAGVAPEDIYPMDIDEAFEACDAIRDKVDLWVERTSQWGVLMQSGEVDIVGASLSRMKDEHEG